MEKVVKKSFFWLDLGRKAFTLPGSSLTPRGLDDLRGIRFFPFVLSLSLSFALALSRRDRSDESARSALLVAIIFDVARRTSGPDCYDGENDERGGSESWRHRRRRRRQPSPARAAPTLPGPPSRAQVPFPFSLPPCLFSLATSKSEIMQESSPEERNAPPLRKKNQPTKQPACAPARSPTLTSWRASAAGPSPTCYACAPSGPGRGSGKGRM